MRISLYAWQFERFALLGVRLHFYYASRQQHSLVFGLAFGDDVGSDGNMVNLVLGYNVELVGELAQHFRRSLDDDADLSGHSHCDLH